MVIWNKEKDIMLIAWCGLLIWKKKSACQLFANFSIDFHREFKYGKRNLLAKFLMLFVYVCSLFLW